MRTSRKQIIAACLAVAGFAGGFYAWQTYLSETSPYARGLAIDVLDGVPVYDNGPVFTIVHGRNYTPDGYYFGQKWQCVEFIKRYRHTARGHRMSDVWGNAINFFDPRRAARRAQRQTRHDAIPPGRCREAAGWRSPSDPILTFALILNVEPVANVKFTPLVFAVVGGYGHVAIVAAVTDSEIEIVQQNAPHARTRLALIAENGGWWIARVTTLGWLRVGS